MISKHGSEDILLIFDPIIHTYNTFRAQKSNYFWMTVKDFHYMDVNKELSVTT
jgi:hypothetical protein